jgi:hypothetical protein
MMTDEVGEKRFCPLLSYWVQPAVKKSDDWKSQMVIRMMVKIMKAGLLTLPSWGFSIDMLLLEFSPHPRQTHKAKTE